MDPLETGEKKKKLQKGKSSTHIRLRLALFYYDKPSVFKFISLLNSTKLKILNNLALYIIKSFELRNTLINERVRS